MATPDSANPETVSAGLDVAWRVSDAIGAQVDALERKAASVATFAGLIVSVTAAFGTRKLESDDWLLDLHLAALSALVAAIFFALLALRPRRHLRLPATAYLQGLNSREQMRRQAFEIRGETMGSLVQGIEHERRVRREKALYVFLAFIFLTAGLGALAAEAATLTVRKSDDRRARTTTVATARAFARGFSSAR
jgi:hypothetical protein